VHRFKTDEKSTKKSNKKGELAFPQRGYPQKRCFPQVINSDVSTKRAGLSIASMMEACKWNFYKRKNFLTENNKAKSS
jgi:hypothetical protein